MEMELANPTFKKSYFFYWVSKLQLYQFYTWICISFLISFAMVMELRLIKTLSLEKRILVLWTINHGGKRQVNEEQPLTTKHQIFLKIFFHGNAAVYFFFSLLFFLPFPFMVFSRKAYDFNMDHISLLLTFFKR